MHSDDVPETIKFVIIDEIDLNLRTNYFVYENGSVVRGLFHFLNVPTKLFVSATLPD